MFGTLGGPELLLILVIALIVFGPRKLPEIGKSLGKMMVEFRRASNDFKRTLEDEVEAEKLRKEIESAQIDVPSSPPTDTAPAESVARDGGGRGALDPAAPEAEPSAATAPVEDAQPAETK
jgi:Tat protein translocase TatB subunit